MLCCLCMCVGLSCMPVGDFECFHQVMIEWPNGSPSPPGSAKKKKHMYREICIGKCNGERAHLLDLCFCLLSLMNRFLRMVSVPPPPPPPPAACSTAPLKGWLFVYLGALGIHLLCRLLNLLVPVHSFLDCCMKNGARKCRSVRTGFI